MAHSIFALYFIQCYMFIFVMQNSHAAEQLLVCFTGLTATNLNSVIELQSTPFNLCDTEEPLSST
jgi:hypothetical protein